MKKWGVLLVLLICSIYMYSFVKKQKHTPYSIVIPQHIQQRITSMHFPNAQNPLSEAGISLGRLLFYDVRLSKNNTISCGSCHIQAFAFSDTATFSRGVENGIGDRNSMSLANIAWNARFFWDGRAATLQDQIHDPIIDKREMNNTWADVLRFLNNDATYKSQFKKVFNTKVIYDTHVKKAIEQFVVSILSFDSPFDHFYYLDDNNAISQDAQQGLKLFFGKARCGNCHNGVLLSNQQFMNNGLDSITVPGLYNATAQHKDYGLNKTPTLRNIAVTAPYMHDGRFKTLEEVLNFYNNNVHGSSVNIDFRMQPFVGGLHLNQDEIKQIITFLNTLTDSPFLKNSSYSNPNL